MTRPAWILALLLSAAPCTEAASADELVYFGTHGSGPGQGIAVARFDPKTGHLTDLGLAAEIERPTWLVPGLKHGAFYAVSETGNDGKSEASVYSLAADDKTGKLRIVNQVGSGGGGATHLALDPKSRTLFVANYGTGEVGALPVKADGSLAPVASKQADQGTGPTPRQTKPHAHAVVLDPSGRFLLVPDLGADRVFVYRFDPKTRVLSAGNPTFAAAAPGSGPRHAVFSPDGKFVYIDSELSGEVTSYAWDKKLGHLSPIETLSILPPDFAGDRSAAEIALSKDGRFLYVSSRSDDAIVAYAVDHASGKLTPIGRTPSGGKTPWSFSLDPSGRWMLVANEASSQVTVLKIDPKTGKLTPTAETLQVPKPVNVTFER